MPSTVISRVDISTFAQLNGISINEAKKIINDKITNKSSATTIKESEEYSFIDGFVSTKSTSCKNAQEEFSFYENIFTTDAKEDMVAKQIQSNVQNPTLIGKTMKEIVKYFAQEMDIFEEDAENIFTPDFVSEVLGIETQDNEEETQKQTV